MRERKEKSQQRGYTLVETLVVMTIVAIMTAVALPFIDNAVRKTHEDIAMYDVVMEMRRARQLALDMRRNHRLTFTTPRTLTITRIGMASLGEPNTVVATVDLPSDISFGRNGIGVNPDPQITTTEAISFNDNPQLYIEFRPDGSGVDAAGTLALGQVMLGRIGDVPSTRAVTLFGSTGRIKGLRFRGSGGTSGSWE
ncbi:MAG TPA: prepilin-type N-terminal cleavage/methylation domain-containing protein [Terriglobia bacterium]|nr:prepilin-type N-terminal cleavage/methylation domain-containing protein [Terriglobia bacterium]